MKTTNLIFSLFAMCILMACNRNAPGINEKVQRQMQQIALDNATFIIDNYAVGDSVWFKRTDLLTQESATEGFVVTMNVFQELVETIEPDVYSEGDEGGKKFEEMSVGYLLKTALQSTNNTFLVTMITCVADDKVTTIGMFNHNADFGGSNLSQKGDTIDLICLSNNKSCTMQRYVGIVTINDANTNETWKMIE